MENKPLVTAIIINYNIDMDTLRICLDSLQNQTYENIEILVIDNGSTNQVIAKAKSLYPEVQFVELELNCGFAEGVNQGIERAQGEYVFIFNNDAEADPKAIEELLAALLRNKDIIGVSPKMMFYHDRGVFDSVGTLIDEYGAAFNMGVGQIDIGQYDLEERVFGACFGAAFLRRSAFNADKVGLLDKSYFMYYEDVDWCFRANMMGYKFMTVPTATVYHFHSASTKKEFSFSRKYFFIERNLLRTIVKDFETRRMIKICIRRLAAHMRNILRGPFRKASCKVIIRFLVDIPVLVIKRRKVQSFRKVSDMEILKYSFGERPCFDPVNYSPLYNLDTLELMYRRLFQSTGSSEHLMILQQLSFLRNNKLRFETIFMKNRLKEILGTEDSRLVNFIREME